MPVSWGTMKALAIIPARGWDDKLPGRLLKTINGKTLVGNAIEQALRSGCFEHKDIVVSSEQDGILREAENNGVSFVRRPDSLVTASVDQVILHAYRVFESRMPQALCVIDPSFPFRTGEDIKRTLDLLSSPLYHSSTTARVYESSVLVSARAGKRGVWRPSPRKKTIVDVGSVRCVQAEVFRATESVISPKGNIFLIPKERALKVSDAWDYLAAVAYAEEVLKVEGRRPV